MRPPITTYHQVVAALVRGALGRAFRPEVPEKVIAFIEALPPADRTRLHSAMELLGTRPGAFALTGRPIPVHWLSPHSAEDLLLRWQGSVNPLTRRVSAAVIALAELSLYGYPGPQWDRIGYPGPLGSPPDEPKRLSPLRIDADEELSCDVVVVGSGAGGGCAAAQLASEGLDVVVLEKGDYYGESDFEHVESEAYRKMYLYGMTLATTDLSVRIVAGSTLGGGTVVNYSTSFRTPDHVLHEWARVSGIDAFVSGEFEKSLDDVADRLGVTTDSSAAGKRDELLEEGLKELGWHVDLMPRAVRGCSQDEACGYCGFGCRIGAKQSSLRTYLDDAAARGARLIVGADARRVIVTDGRATGLVAAAGPHRLTVRARAVVAAAGAIETPALLLRSGLGGQVGRNLHLHPGTAPLAIFDDDVRVWEGTLQTRYSNEFRGWDGGYGPIFETIPLHPGMAAAYIPWVSADEHSKRMGEFRKASFCAVLARDRSSGRVRINRDGSPKVVYNMSRDDEARVASGVILAARVLEAAGAKTIHSPHTRPISYAPGATGAHERWADDTRRAGYRGGRVAFGSWHQMGSCRMGITPATSATNADNQTHEVGGLFVTDGSAFPTASGVNPMLSIYAIAHRAAGRIAAHLQ
jgi:choline dehydrogenase-like flavoprotein